MHRLLLPLLLTAVAHGASFRVNDYFLSANINSQYYDSSNAPLAIDYSLIGALDVPTFHITGTFGFYNDEYPFDYPGKVPADATISLRFTDVTITCSGGTGACNPWAINFAALFTASPASTANVTAPLRGTVVDTFLGIEGTGNNGKGILSVLVSNVTYLSPTVGGYFAELVELGPKSIPFEPFGNGTAVGFTLTGNAMATGTTISMPGSLWYSFEQPVPTNVPEPGTALLVSVALAGAWWLRRYSN